LCVCSSGNMVDAIRARCEARSADCNWGAEAMHHALSAGTNWDACAWHRNSSIEEVGLTAWLDVDLCRRTSLADNNWDMDWCSRWSGRHGVCKIKTMSVMKPLNEMKLDVEKLAQRPEKTYLARALGSCSLRHHPRLSSPPCRPLPRLTQRLARDFWEKLPPSVSRPTAVPAW